jgi:CheY-like chemotaxis protein
LQGAGADAEVVKQKRILVADDDADVRLVLRVILERVGYEVTEATDGTEVLSMTGAEKPDLILLDYAMPKLDGKRTLEQLKADPKTAGIPVVVISATRDTSLADQLRAIGAPVYLVKPWSEGEIENVVAKALKAADEMHGT